MKKLVSMFAALAFVFAIGVSFADNLAEDFGVTMGYWDTNGIAPDGASAEVDLDGNYECDASGDYVCTIEEEPAFDSPENAELNAGAPTTDAIGLLKHD